MTTVYPGPMGTDIAWSPDGMRIAFMGPAGDASAIFTIGIDGRGVEQVTSPRGGQRDVSPHWSPDGSQIAFVRETGGPESPRAFTAEVTSGRETELTTTYINYWTDTPWAPDGQSLAVWTQDSINVIAADASASTPVVQPEYRGGDFPPELLPFDAQFSPDGRQLLFIMLDVVEGGRSAGVWLVDVADPGTARQITPDEGGSPDWQPVLEPIE